MSIKRKVASNTTFLFLDWTFMTISSIIFWSLVTKTFLPDISGIVSTATNLTVTISSITLMGLGTAVYKLIPEYEEKNQKLKVIGVIHYALKLVFISNLLISILLFIFSNNLVSVFNIPSNAIKAVSITLVLHSFFALSTSITQGLQKMKKIAITSLSAQVLKIVFVILLILAGFGYSGVIIGYFLGFLVAIIFRISDMSLLSQSKKISRKRVMLDHAFPALITRISWSIMLNGQFVLLTILSGAEATGLFTVASFLASPIFVLPSIMSTAVSPSLTKLSVGRKTKLQSSLIKSIFRYEIFISLPLSILIIMFSKNLIFLFSSIAYLSASELIPFLVLASIFHSAGSIFHGGLYATGKAKIQRNIVLITAVVFLLSSIPLTYFFSAKGMAVSYASSVIMATILSYFYIRKFIKVKLNWIPILKIIVSSIILIGFLYIIFGFVYNLLSVAIFSLLGGFLYLIVLIPLKFYTEEDLKILRFLAEKVPIFSRLLNKTADALSKII